MKSGPGASLCSFAAVPRAEFSTPATESGPRRSHPQGIDNLPMAAGRALMGMPALTRRRAKDAHQECWHIFYGDVHVGTITERAGVPHDVDQWGWDCGFYPVTHRLEHADGTAVTLEQ